MATYSVWHNQYHTSSTPPSPGLIILRIQYGLQLPLPEESEEIVRLCKGVDGSHFFSPQQQLQQINNLMAHKEIARKADTDYA